MSVPTGLLPEMVRLPADLKVTYQVHPPSSTNLTTSSAKGHSVSDKSSKSSKTGGKSSSILHQPYKASGVDNLEKLQSLESQFMSPGLHHSSAAVTKSTTILSQQQVQIQQQVAGSGLAMASHPHSHPALAAGTGLNAFTASNSQQSGSTSSLFYPPGYAAQNSQFAPAKYAIMPQETYRYSSIIFSLLTNYKLYNVSSLLSFLIHDSRYEALITCVCID